VTPRNVYLRGLAGQTLTRIIKVRAGLDSPLTITPVKFDLEGRLKYEVEEVEKGKLFTIRITTIPGPAGSYRGTLELKTNYPQRPVIRIPISASFREMPPLHLSPSMVVMRGKAGQIITKAVEIKASRDKPLKLEAVSFDLDKKMTYRIEETEPGKRFVVYLTNIPGPAGVFSGTLRLKTNYKEKPFISIRVRASFRD